jgi:molecular chaperone DnaJ
MSRSDYYTILGVERSASSTELRRAFRRLARKHHPEINPGDRFAELRYRRICEAFEVLADPGERESYDRSGAKPAAEVVEPVVQYGFEGFDFSISGGGDEDVFPEIFRPQKPSARFEAERHGKDLQHSLSMSFDESLKGITALVQITRMASCLTCEGWAEIPAEARKPCPACGGRGRATQTRGHMLFARPCQDCGGSGVSERQTCPDCQGAGALPRDETIEIRTPPGVYEGYRIVVPGKGDEGLGGGRAGDLHLLVHVASHPFFTRKGDNLFCSLPVTFTEAALGCRIEVPTVGGAVKVRVPAGVQSGQKLRLSDRGAPSMRGGVKGDLFIQIQVMTPIVHDQRSQELLRELARLNPESPRESMWSGTPETEGIR